MTNRQLRRYEMLVRVSEFGAVHKARSPESSLAGQALATVDSAVQELRGRAVARLALRHESTRARAAAKRALLDALGSISRAADIIQADEPSFPNTFQMPTRRSAQAVLTAADLFARDLEPVAKRFIDHAFPEAIVADFKKLVATYEQLVRDREAGKGETAATRAFIEGTIRAGRAAVRHLGVIVKNTLSDDEEAMAAWDRTCRVPYRRSDVPAETPAGAPPAGDQPSVDVTKSPEESAAVADDRAA